MAYLHKNSIYMSDGVLAGLEYVPENEEFGPERATGMNQEKMLEYLRQNPRLGLELLSYSGNIFYMGESARIKTSTGRTLGSFFSKGNGSPWGDNAYGEFLMDVREAYRKELEENRIEEVRVRPDQVVVDYVPGDVDHEYVSSVIEQQEAQGKRFIHTEKYRPSRFAFDAGRDGTTGHNRRDSDSDVVFQTFECPFGLDKSAKVKVDSAVEVSLYYEQALRGELDFTALFKDLKRRGNIVNMPKAQEDQLINDLQAQFDWMREQISRTDGDLADMQIVSDLNLIPDASFGRSIYDPDLAPSPAHILARYINNPALLFTNSENGVLRALETSDKNEAYRFSAVTGKGTISIVIDGSDTIGGRQPKTRAIREKKINYKKDERGKFVYNHRGEKIVESTEDVYKMQFKSPAEIDADYAAFSARLSSIVANISPEVKISFITGKGTGTPQMVRRFVQENHGKVYDWDYTEKGAYAAKENGNDASDDARYSQLRMPNFQSIYPVLIGKEKSVQFLLDRDDDESGVEFTSKDGLSPKGYVTFSVDEDARNRDLLLRGSLAAEAGVPLIHVQNNRTEEDQKVTLASESSLSRSFVTGEQKYNESLFSGEVKNNWALEGSNVMSYIEDNGNLAIPYVSNYHKAVVYVNGVAFHTIFGAFTALAARESGVTEAAQFQEIAKEEDSMRLTVAAYQKYVSKDLSDEVIERCMRNSVHMMAESSEAFAYTLLNSEGEFVMPSTFEVGKLFTDVQGHGENRFGVVFSAERDALKAELAVQLNKEMIEENHIAEENSVRNKVRGRKRARGEKMSGGLPADIEGTRGAIWFLGTARPSRLFSEKDSSFKWEETNYGKDALNRELASRALLDDGEGGKVENNLVFLFPTDLQAASGRRKVMNNPDGRNLTGVVRVDPKTGKEFTCAFGIPVKKDNSFFEPGNKYGRVTSFMLDHDSMVLTNGVIEADSLARKTALDHDMSLCYAVREKPLANGEQNDDLSRCFSDKVWDYPRTKEEIDRRTGKTITEEGAMLPKEVTKKVYNHETMRYENVTKQVYQRQWVDNPHASKVNREIIKRYESMLDEGVGFPLNCICMPKSDYSQVSEEKFLADFSFALKIANASALAQGVPMRFPLDVNGRLNLGPDVPEKFRDLAERKLDSFIGVVREENIINDELPYIRRVPLSGILKHIGKMKSDGSDLHIKPLELVEAFGGFDFKDVKNGSNVPLHEMSFVMDDGTAFRLTSGKLTSKMQLGEINRYVRYERNDEQRFRITSTDPDRIPEFIEALKSYIERAKRVKIETKLVSEKEAAGLDLGMAGFVNLLSSNSEERADDEFTVAARGAESAIEAPNRFDETDNDSVYYGKEDAKDAFAGYAMARCTLPDGTDSGWRVITDREVALDVIYSSVQRVYRSDIRELPTERLLESEVKAFIIDAVNEKFRSLSQQKQEVKVDSKVVESERYEETEEDRKKTEKVVGKDYGRLFVTYYGSKSVPEDAVKVQISTSVPDGMRDEMDFCFNSLFPDYETMVKAHKEGKIDDAGYTRLYNENVLEPNKEKILNGISMIQQKAVEEQKDAYLYCYCKPGAFCHRYLVNNFLNENGIACQENPADRKRYEIGHVQLYGEQPAENLFNQKAEDVKTEVKDELVSYTVSAGGYKVRTIENAQADDVDFTFQFKAVDSYGEKATEIAAGDSCVSVQLPIKDGKLDVSKKNVTALVNKISEMLPPEFFNGESCGVNLAGNGLYTLNHNGYSVSQEDLDVLISSVFLGLKERGFQLGSLRSGGQTGVDESAAAVAHAMNVPVEIHAPAKWLYRSVEEKDVAGDEKAFKARFNKDYDKIKSMADSMVSKRAKKAANEIKR